MILRLTLLTAGLFVLPVAVYAQTTCVGLKLDVPLPRATLVEWRSADVQSARFSGMWQQGLLDGFSYRIFPDQTATLTDTTGKSSWRIEVLCNQEQATCTQTTFGSAPGAAVAVAEAIGKCLSPQPVVKPPQEASKVVPKVDDVQPKPLAKPATDLKLQPKPATADKPTNTSKPASAAGPIAKATTQSEPMAVRGAKQGSTETTADAANDKPIATVSGPAEVALIPEGSTPTSTRSGTGKAAVPTAKAATLSRACAAPGAAVAVAEAIGKCLSPQPVVKPPQEAGKVVPKVDDVQPKPLAKPATGDKPTNTLKPASAAGPIEKATTQSEPVAVRGANQCLTETIADAANDKPIATVSGPAEVALIPEGSTPTSSRSGTGKAAVPTAKAATLSRACAAPSAKDVGSTIRAIQRLLTEIGRAPGPIDGLLGKRTAEALTVEIGADTARLDPTSILITLVAKICSGG